MMTELGITMHVGHYRTACALPVEDAQALLLDITRDAGMTPFGSPVVRCFPVNGKGGQGYMIVVIFTESCAYCDCYENTATTWWHISSCLPMPYQRIRERLAHCGPITGTPREYEL